MVRIHAVQAIRHALEKRVARTVAQVPAFHAGRRGIGMRLDMMRAVLKNDARRLIP